MPNVGVGRACVEALRAALYLVVVATVILLHGQWTERGRLIYPIVQVPLEMLQEGADQRPGSTFFRDRVTWAGFALPAAIGPLRAVRAWLFGGGAANPFTLAASRLAGSASSWAGYSSWQYCATAGRASTGRVVPSSSA
ncbi:MAG: DUF6785 family protein [Candidatus Latescibacterota bacterium]